MDQRLWTNDYGPTTKDYGLWINVQFQYEPLTLKV